MQVLKGRPYPLGATVDDNGINFAIFSAHATKVTLCLFDKSGHFETQQIQLAQKTQQVWHIYLTGLKAGQVYGYRVDGLYEPHSGHRFNPYKLLLDPYAKQWVGGFVEHDSHYAYDKTSSDEDLSLDLRDNSEYMPKCKALDYRKLPPINPLKREGGSTAIDQSVIYELHVKGFSQQNAAVELRHRGTFLGLSQPCSLAHLANLGVTAVELLPVHSFISEAFLQDKQLTNYWGYNSLGFFAPHSAYLSQGNVEEFRQMVSALHDAGIEVILDVVYNHTAEGNHLGPNLCFKGIDNLSYYRLQAKDKRFYINDTGCGNTLNISHPRVLQLVMDSLRYWVEIMGVDGFRFDLASTLGRESYGFDAGAGFFDAIAQDPVLNRVKLIAEPWDIGPGGYQLGAYPQGWSEWNDRYRDTLRRFWRGDFGVLPEFARRIHGSSDLFEHSARGPSASVNFITSHDGFTLQDLISYAERHNQVNGEDNRDGHQENFSAHHGVEGDTDQLDIQLVRQRQARNLLTCLMLSQGVPMLLAGDEMGHSQQGNNNAYCQDNPLTWLNWDLADWQQQRLQFTRALIALRKRFPALCFPRYIHNDAEDSPLLDWFCRQGQPMTKVAWAEGQTRSLSLILRGELEGVKGKQQALLLMLNSDEQPLEFNVPPLDAFPIWQQIIDTSSEQTNLQICSVEDASISITANQTLLLQDRSLMLFYAQHKGVTA
ncbi:glycogen operon protein GlgX homolog [Shewanella sairae]|uniref:Glycogen operon protein GlgX homolog n=1 Tax=Shewanella sairae TaxID=190310 RepID=A0ABQ4PN71_9GAMM|nr:glycogen debranching protein GlgX [Shewanella sairae]MCL1130137.1 glycogen debranching protein GlgX [Shewanella sairae]GIU49720.1 glycogen operon protein GlgX homolog [Shewanella sairae]